MKLVLRLLSLSRDHHYQRQAPVLVIDERRAATGVELEHVEEVLQLAACPLFDASRPELRLSTPRRLLLYNPGGQR